MWTYEIPTGILLDPSGVKEDTGYSGHPPHVNDVNAIGIEGVGPLPPGNYTFAQLIEDDPETGKYTIVLVPDVATRAYIISLHRDPDSFRMHGDLIGHAGQDLASDGCLIFILQTRMTGWGSPDHALQAVLALPPAPADLGDE
jgi:hypothetical protein